MKINKITVIFVILIIWAVFSVLYVAVDIWRDFQVNQLQQAFNQGSASTVSQIFTRTADCQPVNLFSDEEEINLVRVSCLEQAPEQIPGQVPE